MATSRGRDQVQRRFAQARAELTEKVARGAVRVMANVVADEARERCVSDEVRADIKVITGVEGTMVTGKVIVKGPHAYIARWLEYGTHPHLITAHADVRKGRSVGRINDQVREGSLKIGSEFVGRSVMHPGASRRPFMRVSLDLKEADAIAAGQGYINSRPGHNDGPALDDEGGA